MDPCPVCELAYADFRAPGQPTFAEARQAKRALHDDNITKRNDYSKPPRRAAALGLMHQHKREAWAEHLRLCEEAEEAGWTP